MRKDFHTNATIDANFEELTLTPATQITTLARAGNIP